MMDEMNKEIREAMLPAIMSYSLQHIIMIQPMIY